MGCLQPERRNLPWQLSSSEQTHRKVALEHDKTAKEGFYQRKQLFLHSKFRSRGIGLEHEQANQLRHSTVLLLVASDRVDLVPMGLLSTAFLLEVTAALNLDLLYRGRPEKRSDCVPGHDCERSTSRPANQ